MSDHQPTGTVVWKDLTVENADVIVIRDPAGAVMALINE